MEVSFSLCEELATVSGRFCGKLSLSSVIRSPFRPAIPSLQPSLKPLRILTRYIVFDLLKVFLMTLTVMTSFLFVILVGKEAVENGLGIVPIMRMLPYILPQAMQFCCAGYDVARERDGLRSGGSVQ